MTRKQERELERALRGERSSDTEIEELVNDAGRVENRLKVEAPDASRERSMFVNAAAGRRRGLASGTFVPGLAALALIALVLVASYEATPGQAFYPVRRALGVVGIARSVERDVETRIDRADELLDQAEDAGRIRAKELALDALAEADRAGALLPAAPADERADLREEIEAIEDRAVAIIVASQTVPDPGDDSSGPGSGDDSSGPGSGDRDDDSSGPGSGDRDDDSSGPGSGDRDDDSAGPGSGDRDDDSSGPGSGDDSGSSGGDSSGPGSGSGSDDDSSKSGSG